MKIQGTKISMIRGDSETVKITIQNSLKEIVSLQQGDTIRFTVKKSIHLEDKILQKVITEFVDGVAFIELLPIDTKDLKYGDYLYDIQLTRADESVKTIVPPSTFSILGEVTYE